MAEENYVLLAFSCKAHTRYGEEIRVVGSTSKLGSWDPAMAPALKTEAHKYPKWAAILSCNNCKTEYKYVIYDPRERRAIWESGENREFQLDTHGDILSKAGPLEPHTPKFGVVDNTGPRLARHCDEVDEYAVPVPVTPKVKAGNASGGFHDELHFDAVCDITEVGDTVVAVGSCPELGMWDVRRGLKLGTSSEVFPRWMGVVHVSCDVGTIEFKLAVLKAQGEVQWEPSENRHIRLANGLSEGPCRALCEWGNKHCEVSDRKSVESVGQEPKDGQKEPPVPLLAEKWARLHSGPPPKEQCLTVKMKGLSETDAKKVLVQVAFHQESQRPPMHMEFKSYDANKQQAGWSLAVPSADLTSGHHFFHFKVNGRAFLSTEHLRLGRWNALHVSDPMRRYLLARDSKGQLSEDAPIAEKTPSKKSGNSFRPFAEEVYEDLFDEDLMLHLQGMVLPEAPPPPEGKNDSNGSALRLWAGAHLIQKGHGECEDAFFLGAHGLGVADGVGCMAQFASYGVNAAQYAAELMEFSSAALKRPDGIASEQIIPDAAERAALALAHGECNARSYGASTVSVLCQEGGRIGVANLGDSGFMLLRKGPHGMNIITQSTEQQHSWNLPYQLTRLPQVLVNKCTKLQLDRLDRASDCDIYRADILQGDLILMFSDGLRDNVNDKELLSLVNRALPPAQADMLGLLESCTPPQSIAKALALAAQQRSLDPTATVPFTEYSRRHGVECLGGKQDDITVVAAWVVADESKPSLDGIDVGEVVREMRAATLAAEAAPQTPKNAAEGGRKKSRKHCAKLTRKSSKRIPVKKNSGTSKSRSRTGDLVPSGSSHSSKKECADTSFSKLFKNLGA